MKTLDQLLEKNFSASEQANIRSKAQEKIASIRLQQVRKSQHITQKELAQTLGLSQSALSELERRPNITLGNLHRYIEALGGKLEITAVFQEGKKELLA
ncbi:helix-turn-helix domain-containing protein [Candidatus Electrothrix sp.]|uniref:helix-turn-helix domain-containing protein n=1 Tax=Candidatus Electrothrix sp. TaxID=2170559 RepID=UPI0040575BB4